ncbi:heme-binding protein soul4 [Scomber japonicus]|uniref:heme-binding protein soul4 n=1 Tax=Scomber japonicus TaxID=13676 RepID=UPI00230561E7|nr:heme-binding protein soul4 [Scomber japonicus]XP_053194541.1 heme-binding protein soul4 [Scomber japonicus]XP_053194549.1 heme-binding protein soul4 [Scomber japonicus]
MALISLEDLDGLDDEQLDDDITDNPEPMDEENSDRLLAYWQEVGRGHQVTVPPEMTGPIQEMTRNSQQREPLPFVSVSRHEKLGQVCEERVYPAGRWVTVTSSEDLYEQSISTAFMRLMRFICKENSTGRYLGMTVPVVSSVQMMEDRKSFGKEVMTAFFLPAEFQQAPPTPTDPAITVVDREPIRVIASTFFGTTNEETVLRQVTQLWEVLGSRPDVLPDTFMVAVYENPGVPQRRNEIWFLCRNP